MNGSCTPIGVCVRGGPDSTRTVLIGFLTPWPFYPLLEAKEQEAREGDHLVSAAETGAQENMRAVHESSCSIGRKARNALIRLRPCSIRVFVVTSSQFRSAAILAAEAESLCSVSAALSALCLRSPSRLFSVSSSLHIPLRMSSPSTPPSSGSPPPPNTSSSNPSNDHLPRTLRRPPAAASSSRKWLITAGVCLRCLAWSRVMLKRSQSIRWSCSGAPCLAIRSTSCKRTGRPER